MPIQLALIFLVLYQMMGYTFLIGFGIMIIIILLNLLLGKIQQKYLSNFLRMKDQRINLTNQILKKIKYIKINVLEDLFSQKLELIREEEISQYWKKIQCVVYQILSLWTAPNLITFTIFFAMIQADHEMSAYRIFSLVSLIQILQFAIRDVPLQITDILDFLISYRRIQKLFDLSDVRVDFLRHDTSDKAILIRHGNFCWTKPSNDPAQPPQKPAQILDVEIELNKTTVRKELIEPSTLSSEPTTPTSSQLHLKNIDLEIKKGSFIGVLGRYVPPK